ncbi:hypothetical protein KJ567_06365 [Candidatus Bipolaricaulota bacterium]|nr:hypothetical protein [Candidatus Bipolaricaulota bacterium]
MELPQLLPIDRAVELLGVDEETILSWLRAGAAQGMRVNGIQHVLTHSIADRLGEATEQKPNQADLGDD